MSAIQGCTILGDKGYSDWDSSTGQYQVFYEMTPGKGYWVYIQDNCTAVIPGCRSTE